MKLLIIILSFLLFSFPLLGNEKTCFVRVNSSDDFNQTLLSDISISLISQYLIKIKSFPSTGLSDGDHCIYEVTATLDDKKTYVTLQGNNLNSFGDSTIFGMDGFQQAILRSLYRSQRDKRELICSDYPKILEECGGVVRKSEKKVVNELTAQKKVKPKEKVVVSKQQKSTKKTSTAKASKKKYKNEKGVEMCWFPELKRERACDWRERGNRTAEAAKRGTIECGGYRNVKWTNKDLTEYVCK